MTQKPNPGKLLDETNVTRLMTCEVALIRDPLRGLTFCRQNFGHFHDQFLTTYR